jgi:hypothetical protein
VFIITDRTRGKGEGSQKVSIPVMKVKELNLEETESSHTLGGAIVVYYKSIKRDL